MERTPTVGIIIIKGNKVLLVEHGESSGHITGSLGTPGGRLEKGESLEKAATRELQEETGLTIVEADLNKIPHIYEAELLRKSGETLYVTHTVFTTNKFSGDLRGTSETTPKWIEIKKLSGLKLLVNTEDMVRRALKILFKTNPRISLIAAIGKNRELGRGNDLIFKIPEDMKNFREVTKGHPIIMGRKTFESIGRVLPNRLNIVITRDTKVFLESHPEFTSGSLDSGSEAGMTKGLAVSSLDEALKEALRHAQGKQNEEIFVIGGGQIFSEAIKVADKLYLTVVDSEAPDADVFFPDYSEFKKVISEKSSRDENYKYRFLELEK